MKGTSLGPVYMITMLVAIGSLILLVAMFFRGFFETTTIVNENEVERHAIIMGNILLSSNKLVHSDGNKNFRGVFDKEKLDKVLLKVNSISGTEDMKNPAKEIEVAYPNSVAIVRIWDLETGNGWYASLVGESVMEGYSSVKALECLFGKIKIDLTTIFRMPLLSSGQIAPLPWSQEDLKKCQLTYFSSSGVSTQGFPVAIRVSDSEVHIGTLIVNLMEA
jgi:hypothetical protein